MPRIAIVHDWLTTYAGSERVLEQMLQVYPQADLFALLDLLPEAERLFLGGRPVRTSSLQRYPFINRDNYRNYLPFMPRAIQGLDLSTYEVILSSCHAVSKGVRTRTDQLHISYLHSPMRYAWDMQDEYLINSGFGRLKRWAARLLLKRIQKWDLAAAQRPTLLLANSHYIAGRVEQFYRRQAQVIYPPVDVDKFQPAGTRQDFYLAASRLVPYKRLDLVARAFMGMPDRQLVIIGDGPEGARWRQISAPNIHWLGYQPDAVLLDYLQRCRAFVFAAREDFGILPLEAQACGVPVIAFGQGGLAETIQGLDHPQPGGVFFLEQTEQAIRQALQEFERNSALITPQACRRNAERFSIARFRRELAEFVDSAWVDYKVGKLVMRGKLG